MVIVFQAPSFKADILYLVSFKFLFVEGLVLNLKTYCSTKMHIAFERRNILHILDFKNYFKERYFLMTFSAKNKRLCLCKQGAARTKEIII